MLFSMLGCTHSDHNNIKSNMLHFNLPILYDNVCVYLCWFLPIIFITLEHVSLQNSDFWTTEICQVPCISLYLKMIRVLKKIVRLKWLLIWYPPYKLCHRRNIPFLFKNMYYINFFYVSFFQNDLYVSIF